MSSILKALRKVEDDKAALGEGSVDLAHDILKQNYRQATSFPWLFAVGVLLTTLLLIVAAWFWFVPAQRVADKHLLTERTVQPVPSSPVAEALPPAADVVPAVVEERAEPQKAVAEEVSPSPSVASGPVVDIPDLQVEEIIYQQEAASRLAVVNGLPVMEGTDIEGARVEQISIDRVQFMFQGVRFNKYKVNID